MIEFVLIAAVVVLFVKIAGADVQGSPGTWGSIAFLACMVSLVIPLPFVRVLMAAGVVFAAMIGYNMLQASKPAKGAKIGRGGRR